MGRHCVKQNARRASSDQSGELAVQIERNGNRMILSQVSSVLMELEGLQVRSDSACATALGQVTQSAITDDMVCAGVKKARMHVRGTPVDL